MKYQRFEDLPVWNDAVELAVHVLQLSQAGRLTGIGDLKSQLERAVISISNNIAEGFERGTNQELVTFLYYARGSTGEVRSMLHLFGRLVAAREWTAQIDDLLRRTHGISRQLGGWIESLKNSEFKGTRSQNDRTRAALEATRRRDQFLERVRDAQDQALRQRPPAPDGDPLPG